MTWENLGVFALCICSNILWANAHQAEWMIVKCRGRPLISTVHSIHSTESMNTSQVLFYGIGITQAPNPTQATIVTKCRARPDLISNKTSSYPIRTFESDLPETSFQYSPISVVSTKTKAETHIFTVSEPISVVTSISTVFLRSTEIGRSTKTKTVVESFTEYKTDTITDRSTETRTVVQSFTHNETVTITANYSDTRTETLHIVSRETLRPTSLYSTSIVTVLTTPTIAKNNSATKTFNLTVFQTIVETSSLSFTKVMTETETVTRTLTLPVTSLIKESTPNETNLNSSIFLFKTIRHNVTYFATRTEHEPTTVTTKPQTIIRNVTHFVTLTQTTPTTLTVTEVLPTTFLTSIPFTQTFITTDSSKRTEHGSREIFPSSLPTYLTKTVILSRSVYFTRTVTSIQTRTRTHREKTIQTTRTVWMTVSTEPPMTTTVTLNECTATSFVTSETLMNSKTVESLTHKPVTSLSTRFETSSLPSSSTSWEPSSASLTPISQPSRISRPRSRPSVISPVPIPGPIPTSRPSPESSTTPRPSSRPVITPRPSSRPFLTPRPSPTTIDLPTTVPIPTPPYISRPRPIPRPSSTLRPRPIPTPIPRPIPRPRPAPNPDPPVPRPPRPSPPRPASPRPPPRPTIRRRLGGNGGGRMRGGGCADPLVFDTNQDGFISATNHFGIRKFHENGTVVMLGSATNGDKMLAMCDFNGNGEIDHGEVFGDGTVNPFEAHPRRPSDGFSALKQVALSASRKFRDLNILSVIEENTTILVNLHALKIAFERIRCNLGFISDANNRILEPLGQVVWVKVNNYMIAAASAGDHQSIISFPQKSWYLNAQGERWGVDDVWFSTDHSE